MPMRNRISIDRRQFVGGAAALGVSALALPAGSAVSPSIGNLPGRGSSTASSRQRRR
jgi:hypothetical protein